MIRVIHALLPRFEGLRLPFFSHEHPVWETFWFFFSLFFFLDFDGSGPRFFEGEGGINLNAMLFWKWKNMGEREKGKMVTIYRIGKY